MFPWNEHARLVEVLGAIVIRDNSDDAALTLAHQVVEAARQTEESNLAPMFEEISHFLSTDDPYRAAIIAWIFGCLAELQPMPQWPAECGFDWATRAIRMADELLMKGYSELPKGELSTEAEVEAKIAELSVRYPSEARAWQAVKDHYSSITTPLGLFPELRQAFATVIEPLARIADHLRGAYFILMLARVPFREKFIVIQHDVPRGFVAEVTDLESNFQLVPALADTLAEVFDDESLRLSEEERPLVFSPAPDSFSTPRDRPQSTRLMGFEWRALRSDGSLPMANKDPSWEVWSDRRIYIEHHPWDIAKISGHRVVLFHTTTLQTYYWWGRNYGHLNPSVNVTRVLGTAEAQDLIKRLAYVNHVLHQGDAEDFDEWNNALIKGIGNLLPSRQWKAYFFSRMLRRMLPYVHQSWPSHSSQLLVQIYRVLDTIDAAIFGQEEVGAGAELAGQLVTFLSRASRAQLVRPTLSEFARAMADLADWLGDDLDFHDRRLHHVVFRLWQEALQDASAAGAEPDSKALGVALAADRDRLAELATSGELTADRFHEAGELWPQGRPGWWPLLPEYALGHFEYEVVLSFAGEQRAVARELADRIRRRGCRVFYDEDVRRGLLGDTLPPLLHSVFRDRAMCCVVLVSSHYSVKPWPRLEWAAICERMVQDPAYLLPLRLDDTPLEGLADTLGHLDLRQVQIDEAAQAVAEHVTARIADQLTALRAAAP